MASSLNSDGNDAKCKIVCKGMCTNSITTINSDFHWVAQSTVHSMASSSPILDNLNSHNTVVTVWGSIKKHLVDAI